MALLSHVEMVMITNIVTDVRLLVIVIVHLDVTGLPLLALGNFVAMA